MSNKYDEPPAYSAPGPQPPQAAYHGYQNAGYGQQGTPPPQGGYYQPGPPMGYYPQQQPPYGQPYGPPPQGAYYGPQGGYYQDNRSSGPGCLEAMLASLACCCCLDCLLF